MTLPADELDTAGCGLLQPGDDAEQGALATTVWANHGMDASRLHHQVDPGENGPSRSGVSKTETANLHLHRLSPSRKERDMISRYKVSIV
jgi:hypothetical protein